MNTMLCKGSSLEATQIHYTSSLCCGRALAARKLPLLGLTDPAQAQEKTWRHGGMLFGDLKYPAGVHQLEYANAIAPKRAQCGRRYSVRSCWYRSDRTVRVA